MTGKTDVDNPFEETIRQQLQIHGKIIYRPERRLGKRYK